MGWLIVALGGFATYNLSQEGQVIWAFVAGAATLTNFWSYGVMHNLAMEAARGRSARIEQFRDEDLAAVPNWLTNINIGTAVIIGALLLWLAVSEWI